MQPADRIEFVKILNGLALTKPGTTKLAPEALNLWWNSMQDWSIDEFRSAANHLARAVEFMPNPYHFEQLRKAGHETAGEAWQQVREMLPRLNWHERVSISPRVDRVVRAMGGYQALALTNTDNMPFREKRFRELWEELGDAEEARIALPSSAGRNCLTGPQSARNLLPGLRRDRPCH